MGRPNSEASRRPRLGTGLLFTGAGLRAWLRRPCFSKQPLKICAQYFAYALFGMAAIQQQGRQLLESTGRIQIRDEVEYFRILAGRGH